MPASHSTDPARHPSGNISKPPPVSSFCRPGLDTSSDGLPTHRCRNPPSVPMFARCGLLLCSSASEWETHVRSAWRVCLCCETSVPIEAAVQLELWGGRVDGFCRRDLAHFVYSPVSEVMEIGRHLCSSATD